jgi:hypothetical protein
MNEKERIGLIRLAANPLRRPLTRPLNQPASPLRLTSTTHRSPSNQSQQQQQQQSSTVGISEQRGHIESSEAAAGGGAAGQPTSSSGGSGSGRLADSSSQQSPAAAFSFHSAAASSADAAMSDADGGSAAATSTSAAADSETTAAAADQPPSQPPAHSQTQSQPQQLAVDSMALDKVIEAMAAVPTQPAHEFVLRQLRLIGRLGELLGIGDSASWLRAPSAFSAEQALTLIQTALRVEAEDERADRLVSDRSRASGSRRVAQRDASAAALPRLTPIDPTRACLFARRSGHARDSAASWPKIRLRT